MFDWHVHAVAKGIVGIDVPVKQVAVELLNLLGILGLNFPVNDRIRHNKSPIIFDAA